MMILFGKDHLFLTEDDSVACQKNVDFQFYEKSAFFKKIEGRLCSELARKGHPFWKLKVCVGGSLGSLTPMVLGAKAIHHRAPHEQHYCSETGVMVTVTRLSLGCLILFCSFI